MSEVPVSGAAPEKVQRNNLDEKMRHRLIEHLFSCSTEGKLGRGDNEFFFLFTPSYRAVSAVSESGLYYLYSKCGLYFLSDWYMLLLYIDHDNARKERELYCKYTNENDRDGRQNLSEEQTTEVVNLYSTT